MADTISDFCLHCDLRQDVKKRVSYTVLSLIMTVAVVVFGYYTHNISSSVDKIEATVKELSASVNRVQVDHTKLTTRQEQLRKEVDQIQLRNVTQSKDR